MKKSEKSPEVTLNYSGNYFTEENFKCMLVAEAYAPVFEQLASDFSLRSTNFQVLQMDKKLAYHVRKDAFGEKQAYLSDKNYITVEKGVAGFDFEEKVFIVNVTPSNDGFTIDIEESMDSDLNEELMAIVCTENRSSAKDHFDVCITSMTLPKKDDMDKGLHSYMDFVENKLSKLRETRFLDIDSWDETHKYLYIDNRFRSQFNQISGDHYLMDDYFFRERSLSIQAQNGNFMPFVGGYFNDKALSDIGTLKLKGDVEQKEFFILEPAELLHDIDAHMWLKTRVKYRYPQDAKKIAEEYPRLIKEVTQQKEHWRDITPLDKKPKVFSLGEQEMYVPCENVRNLWSMRNSPFHFIDRPGAGIRYGKEQILHSDEGNFGVFFVNYGNDEYIVRYKKEEKKRFCRDVYNHYTFYDFLPLSDLLANPDKNFETYALVCTYQFEIMRYGIKSTPIDENTFNLLDMAKREEPKEEKPPQCPLVGKKHQGLPPTPPIPSRLHGVHRQN